LKCPNVLYPPHLYKGIVWQDGGNNKLLYVGVQDQYYTYTMFDLCGLWAAKYVQQEISLPGKETMDKNWREWVEKNKQLKDCYEAIKFQTDYVMEIAADCGEDYPFNIDVTDIFNAWEDDKHDNILTYRDKSFASKFTGTPSPIHHTTFMKALDDSLETFMHQKKWNDNHHTDRPIEHAANIQFDHPCLKARYHKNFWKINIFSQKGMTKLQKKMEPMLSFLNKIGI